MLISLYYSTVSLFFRRNHAGLLSSLVLDRLDWCVTLIPVNYATEPRSIMENKLINPKGKRTPRSTAAALRSKPYRDLEGSFT